MSTMETVTLVLVLFLGAGHCAGPYEVRVSTDVPNNIFEWNVPSDNFTAYCDVIGVNTSAESSNSSAGLSFHVMLDGDAEIVFEGRQLVKDAWYRFSHTVRPKKEGSLTLTCNVSDSNWTVLQDATVTIRGASAESDSDNGIADSTIIVIVVDVVVVLCVACLLPLIWRARARKKDRGYDPAKMSMRNGLRIRPPSPPALHDDDDDVSAVDTKATSTLRGQEAVYENSAGSLRGKDNRAYSKYEGGLEVPSVYETLEKPQKSAPSASAKKSTSSNNNMDETSKPYEECTNVYEHPETPHQPNSSPQIDDESTSLYVNTNEATRALGNTDTEPPPLDAIDASTKSYESMDAHKLPDTPDMPKGMAPEPPRQSYSFHQDTHEATQDPDDINESTGSNEESNVYDRADPSKESNLIYEDTDEPTVNPQVTNGSTRSQDGSEVYVQPDARPVSSSSSDDTNEKTPEPPRKSYLFPDNTNNTTPNLTNANGKTSSDEDSDSDLYVEPDNHRESNSLSENNKSGQILDNSSNRSSNSQGQFEDYEETDPTQAFHFLSGNANESTMDPNIADGSTQSDEESDLYELPEPRRESSLLPENTYEGTPDSEDTHGSRPVSEISNIYDSADPTHGFNPPDDAHTDVYESSQLYVNTNDVANAHVNNN